MPEASKTQPSCFSTLPSLSCGCMDDKASFSVLAADDDDVVLSPFSKPGQRGAAGEASYSHPCFADELEQEILELEKAPQLQVPRSAQPKAYSNLSSSYGSVQTSKPQPVLQGQGSFHSSECGLLTEASNSMRSFSATAECQPVRAGLRRKQPLAVALENVRRLRLHGVASRPGAWQGCSKSSECNREERHRGLCNRRATIPGVASYPEPEVQRTAIAMGMPVGSLSLGTPSGQEQHSDLESLEGSLQGSDQSDQTLLGFSTSCNGDGESEDAQEEDHNADEDEEDQHQSEQEECAEETLDPYHSDDESWADGVSSGVSLSDCDSPAMGLSAFDGPLRDVHDSGDDRPETMQDLLPSEYDAEGVDVSIQPVSNEVFADDLHQEVVYGSQELSLAWHCPPTGSFLPDSCPDVNADSNNSRPEMSMDSQTAPADPFIAEQNLSQPDECPLEIAPLVPSHGCEPHLVRAPSGSFASEDLADKGLLQLPRARLPGSLRNSVARPTSRKTKRPLEFNTEGPAYPGQQCTQCSTQSTPVWRAGPLGPKTLCNACGVRYMKVAKRTR